MVKIVGRTAVEGEVAARHVLEAADGSTFEAVRLGWFDDVTVCMSAQAGCAYGCLHCATTFSAVPFQRSLAATEIEETIHLVQTAHPGQPIRTVDFSGIGDSSRNWLAVSTAGQQMLERGTCQRVTVTSIAPRSWISRLLRPGSWLPSKLVFSLHGATSHKRREVIPFAEDPAGAIPRWAELALQVPITLNYTMLSVNTSPADAVALAGLLQTWSGSFAAVRLSPLNPVPGSPLAPSQRPDEFEDEVRELLPQWTINRFRPTGSDIEAACGQLRIRGLASCSFRPGHRPAL